MKNHGIRDEGLWTNKIAQRVILKNEEANENKINKKQYIFQFKLYLQTLESPLAFWIYLSFRKQQRHFAIETSRYGYFPMLLFAFPWTRRAKVGWFIDQYAENLVLYPKAKFSFVGHSNGTYLLAQALKEYQCCKFNRVVFAGSVVPKEYDWSTYIDDGRVTKVLNYVATFDWVVAIFPNFLHWFQKDLGSAGHDGFDDNRVTNIRYVEGEHGAALSEHNWDAIAEFIVADSADLPDLEALQNNEIFKYPRSEWSKEKFWKIDSEKCLEVIGKFPLIAWIAIILTLAMLGRLILVLMSSWAEWQQTVVFISYLWLIWTILTRI